MTLVALAGTPLVLGACGDDDPGNETEVRVYPDSASAPDPASGTTELGLELTLSWTGPEDAASYDVYLGDDAIDVAAAEANGAAFIGNTSAATWDLTELSGASTYFWRVDTHFDDGGVSVGRLWSFSTVDGDGPPPVVTTPDPADGASNVAQDATLGWAESAGATSYDVYFSQSASDVISATTADTAFAGNVTETSWTPAGLDSDKTYFWRVDALNENGATTGTLWSFSTVGINAPERATNPTPAADAEDVLADTTLSWTGDDEATAFQLYITASLAAATADEPTDTIWSGEVTETTYAPDAPFDLGRTVYWRVDTLAQGGTTRGVVWSFDTEQPELPLAAVVTMPTNGETDVATDATFAWEGGDGATEFELFLAADDAELASVGITTETTWAPEEPLQASTAYRWRVDARNQVGTVAGEVATFDTAAPAPRPFFRGAELALALGPDALLVGWSDALDDVTAAADFEYAVYIGADDDSIDWETPVATLVGETRTVLDAASLGSPAAGSTMAVAVRAFDADGTSDGNSSIITAWFPDGETRLYLDAAAAAGGDGSFATPYSTMGEAIAGLNASADPSLALVVLAGEYSGEAALTTASTVRIIGGVGEVADDADDAILAAYDPWNTPSVWTNDGAATEGMLGLGSGVRHLIGMTFSSYTGTAVVGDYVELLLMGSRFTDAEYYYDDDAGEGVETCAADLSGSGEPVGLEVVGCRFEDINEGLRIGVPLSHLAVRGNDVHNVDGAIVSWVNYYDADLDENVEEPVEVSDSFATYVQGNTGWRTSSLVRLGIAGAPNNDARTFELDLANNRLRGCRSDVVRLARLGGLGSGAEFDFDIRDNAMWSMQGDLVDLSYSRYDDLVPEFASLTLVAVDNTIVHGNSEGLRVSGAVPSTGGRVDVLVARNFASNLESEFFDYSGLYLEADDYESLVTRSDIELDFVIEDNIAWATDGLADFYEVPFALTGQVNILVEDNFNSGSGDGVYISNPRWWWNPADADERAFDFNVEIVGNSFSVEDGGVEVRDLDLTGGALTFDIRDNDFVTGDAAIYLRNRDFNSEDEIDIEYDLSDLPATNALYRIANNTARSTGDGLETSVRGGQTGSRLEILNNDFWSYDDRPMDMNFADVDVFIHHNTLRGVDDDGIKLNQRETQFEGHSLVSVFDNMVGPVERAVFDFRTEPAPDGVAQRELDIWVANNDFQDSNESESAYFSSIRNSLMLFERNLFGRSDVDSDEGLNVSCSTASVGVFRNNIVWDSGGDGLDIRNCGFETWNSTIGASAGTSTSDAGLSSNSDQFFVANSVVSGNAGDGDFEAFSSPPVYTFYQNGWMPGFGSIEGPEAYRGCSDPLDTLECARMAPWAPTYDAGHPNARFNDVDGSRNDMGAFGGRHAGEIGPLAGEPSAPLSLIGLRPFADLNAGVNLLDPSSPITLVFNQEVDPSSIAGAVSLVSFEADEVSGTFATDGNRVTFTPSSPLDEATHYEVRVSTAITTAEGQPMGAPEFRYVTTRTSAVIELIEPNNSSASATGIDGPVFHVEDGFDPYGAVTEDRWDIYSFDLEAGERLIAQLVMDSPVASPQYAAFVAVTTTDFDSLVSWAILNLQVDDDSTHGESYVDFVAPESGTYFVALIPNLLLDSDQENWPEYAFREEPVATDYVSTYTLRGMVRPLTP